MSYNREEKLMFHFPMDIEGAKDVGRVLSRYKETHYYTVLLGMVIVYILYPKSMLLCVCTCRSLECLSWLVLCFAFLII